MNRAERRRRREVKIAKRQRVVFGFYAWDKDHNWWVEPGRLSKYNTSCSCCMCRACRKNGRQSRLNYRVAQVELAEYENILRKRNRVMRSPEDPPFLKRGGIKGTRV